jgi:hypothetical protein
LYKTALEQVDNATVGTLDDVARSSLASLVKKNFCHLFEHLRDGRTAVSIHQDTLERFRDQWINLESSNTCFCCIRRRPLYDAPCGHCICENCVVVFGDNDKDDPWLSHVRSCFLCSQELPKEVAVRVHPPTAGAAVLCMDGGGARGITQLMQLKLIQDRLGLPIPLARFFKVVFGVSIGQFLDRA